MKIDEQWECWTLCSMKLTARARGENGRHLWPRLVQQKIADGKTSYDLSLKVKAIGRKSKEEKRSPQSISNVSLCLCFFHEVPWRWRLTVRVIGYGNATRGGRLPRVRSSAIIVEWLISWPRKPWWPITAEACCANAENDCTKNAVVFAYRGRRVNANIISEYYI